MSDSETRLATDQYIVFQVSNDQSREIGLALEPWGDVKSIAPGESFDLAFRGPSGGLPVIQVSDGYITVFGWSGCVIKLYKDGVIVPGYEREMPPVPSIPSGMGMQRFIGMMFSGSAQPQNGDAPNGDAPNGDAPNGDGSDKTHER